MINFKRSPHRQKGASLLTVLVFLILMTVIGISTSKIAIVNTLVAGNDQKQIEIYQTAANELRELATVSQLATPMVDGLFDDTTGEYNVPVSSDKPGISGVITDKNKTECNGFGKAISLGAGGILCHLYQFDVSAAKSNSSIKDRHIIGASKEVPNDKKNNAISD